MLVSVSVSISVLVSSECPESTKCQDAESENQNAGHRNTDSKISPGGQKIKANDRRSAGLVAYPRIGRNSELSLSKSDRAQGMLHYPRVRRSDVLNFGNRNRFHDLPPETDVDLYAVRDVDPDALLDFDYEEYAGKLMALKRADKAPPRNGVWLMTDHVHGYKDSRSAQRIEDPRLYYSVLRDSRNTQGQGGYTPRLGRENERDAVGYL